MRLEPGQWVKDAGKGFVRKCGPKDPARIGVVVGRDGRLAKVRLTTRTLTAEVLMEVGAPEGLLEVWWEEEGRR